MPDEDAYDDFRFGETPVPFVGGALDETVMPINCAFIESYWGNYRLTRTAEGWRMICTTPAVMEEEKAWDLIHKTRLREASRDWSRMRIPK
jgi:hypothetical protein